MLYAALSGFAGILSIYLTPVALVIASLVLLPYVRPLRVLRPRKLLSALTDLPDSARSSPLRALSLALAGTLGVGNITGVASALASGGPGAVFWMWMGALLVIPVKYAEVSLAVRFRRRNRDGWYGGAMYYIREGLSGKFPETVCTALGGGFAVLCALNALITGNLVQANAAACVVPPERRMQCGAVLGGMVLFSLLWGVPRIERITSALIPPLTGGYLLLSLGILAANAAWIPGILREIVSCAFSPRAFLGAAAGFSVREALRFGIMRGIFSNEAGCGTSPTAHASAETKSPHHQACYGAVEVAFDTLLLCTVTALVLLTADRRYGLIPWHSECDMAPVTLDAFGSLAGEAARLLLAVSVILFAFGTMLAQLYYGTTALGYLTAKKEPRILYSLLSAVCPLVGAGISAPVLWLSADLILGIMTVVNCSVLILLRRLCPSPSPEASSQRPPGDPD